MPKKKKSLRRPSLKFVHSPGDESPPRLTPDEAVSNPVTAKEIAIDTLNNQQIWVSPHFDGAKESNRSKKISHSNHKKQLTQNKSLRNSRYKPLSFCNQSLKTCKEKLREQGSLKLDADYCEQSSRDIDPTTSNEYTILRDKANTPNAQNEDLSHVKTVLKKHYIICRRFSTDVGKGEPVHPSIASGAEMCEINEENPKTADGKLNICKIMRKVLNKSTSDCSDNELVEPDDVNCATPDLSAVSCGTPQERTSKVLALDTPQSEYDLTFRQRQLKHVIKQKLDFMNCQ